MADVFLAHDDVLDREVALKVMSGRYARDDEFVERFRREAQSAAALSHPNIVSIYDRGESEEGTYYIAMEYLPGGTLKNRIIEGGALPARTAAAVALQIACALQAAHQRDVIHRDIKPHNILITGSGDIKVTDFGIARAATSSTMTRTGSIMGTAHYLSPEQAMGEPAGPASDLYSLGVVLYEMLTGELPYDADTPIGIAMKHVNGPLRPPKELDPSIPGGIDAICVRLLAKNPDDRYTSDADLIEDLERASNGVDPKEDTTEMMTRAISSVPPGGGPRRNGKRRRRTPVALIFLLLAIVGLLAGGAYAMLQNLQEEQNTLPPSRIEVPKLAGMTVDEAQDQVGDDFEIVESDRVDGKQPVDTIVSQNPPQGQELGQGSEISVDVVGTQVADVPNVRGSPRDEAENTLAEAGFTVGVDEEESLEQAGTVISQDPAAGGSEEVDSEVRITVSTGSPTVEMPDIVGETPEQAAATLADNNLVLGASSDTQPSAEAPEGSILYQNPVEGTEVEEGSEVDVTISSGLEQVVVPEIYGMPVLQARQTLEAAGLAVDPNYIMVDPGQSGEAADTALETDPLAGATVDEGTFVSLIASTGPASPSPTPSASASASASSSPEASPEASPEPPVPEPVLEGNADSEARQKAREAQQEAQQAAREAQLEAGRDAQKEIQKDNNRGEKGRNKD